MSTEISFESDPSSPSSSGGGAGGGIGVANWPVTGQVAITDVATLIVGNRSGRGPVTIKNIGETNILWVGNEGVAANTGFELKPGEGKTYEVQHALYGICSDGESTTANFSEDGS